jgi:hypothetical protein
MSGVSRCFALIKRLSPAAVLSGCGLLIIASGRLAHAVVICGALVWVYGLSSLVIYTSAKILPRRGRAIMISFLSSFMAAVYLFLLWLLSPLCAMESFFVVSFVPVLYIASGVSKRPDFLITEDPLVSIFMEALSLCVLLLAFALIREPLGFMSLSLPGGPHGSVMLFSFKTESLFPVQLIASSGGALLLFGYFFGLYNFVMNAQEVNKNAK